MEIFGYHPDLKKSVISHQSGHLLACFVVPACLPACLPARLLACFGVVNPFPSSHPHSIKPHHPHHPSFYYRWTEIGNSGIFRPEMLRPMGLPDGVRVIAWGLSLERPTMIKYRIANIRELFGHKAALERTKAAPVCQF